MTMRKIVVENDLTAEEKELDNVKGVRFYLDNGTYISVYYDHLGSLKIGGTCQLAIMPSSANLLTVSALPLAQEFSNKKAICDYCNQEYYAFANCPQCGR